MWNCPRYATVCVHSVTVLTGLLLSACGDRSGAGVPSSRAGNAELIAIHHGRLVDVYGFREVEGEMTFSLFQTDVLIGTDILDQRRVGENHEDRDIQFDFIGANPDTLQPRLFIPRDVESEEFAAAFDRLDDGTRVVAPAMFGQTDSAFPIIPRNSGIRLTFSGDLGIDDGFFVDRDEAGGIVGVRNTEAIQVLKIVGDPTDEIPFGDFELLPMRIGFARDVEGDAVRPNQIVIDPVLLAGEGLAYQTRNNPTGLPEAADQFGANIRIAVALEGPLAIPGVREDRVGNLVGLNNSGRRSVIRDLRSGHRLDESLDIARGFIRDTTPPRIVGNILLFLERVDGIDEITQEITIFKNGVIHELDRGDVFRFIEARGRTSIPVAVTEVIEDPIDDRSAPQRQHVRVRVRRPPRVTNGLGQLVDPLEAIDPSDDPGFPQDPVDREAWLVQNAARAILVTEFTASRTDPDTEIEIRDDPRNFITFSPSPLPKTDGSPSEANQNVSPYAGAIMRFTKPMDLSSASTADSYFFATRNLLDPEAIEAFRAAGGRGPGSPEIDPGSFNVNKFRTPHLIASRLFDEDGSQTALRLQPILGFYLDDKVREDEGKGFEDKRFQYFLHVLAGESGITDLSGNPIDLQADEVADSERIVIPFSLDTRMRNAVEPLFPDNIVASVVRGYNDVDEDEQPSYYRPDEVQPAGAERTVAAARSVSDIFGAVLYLGDGTLQARPTSRVRKVVDNLNQSPPPDQRSELRWCPTWIEPRPDDFRVQTASSTTATAYGAGIQNPLNPYGCRLQTVWREVDMSLSRLDPFDFNLDVEQMYWAPFTGRPIFFDYFDRLSLFLGHSEQRPEPCLTATTLAVYMQNSGLQTEFSKNYLNNLIPQTGFRPGEIESAPDPHPAYLDVPMEIRSSLAITESNGINRYLPLPRFQKPYFVWRDETVLEQGGASGLGTDADPDNLRAGRFPDYIPSPFLGGHGRMRAESRVLGFGQSTGTWSNADNWQLESGLPDIATGGLVGAIALPLLADFWTYCDTPALPEGNGFIAGGVNGWQISLAAAANVKPVYRTFSTGFRGFSGAQAFCVDPSSPAWLRASGATDPQGNALVSGGQGNLSTVVGDSSIYWIMADFVKRATVVTAGFVEIDNPHRVATDGSVDPRLGPFLGEQQTSGMLPRFTYAFEPPLESLPSGTSVDVEFRGAGVVDPDPWRARWDQRGVSVIDDINPPTPDNFALDPRKAGDAHIRKYDDRSTEFTGGRPRHSWTYLYNRTVTDYTQDPNQLVDLQFAERYSGPVEQFLPEDVEYFNWRFVMSNNVDASPPISPTIDTFIVTYRFERSR